MSNAKYYIKTIKDLKVINIWMNQLDFKTLDPMRMVR